MSGLALGAAGMVNGGGRGALLNPVVCACSSFLISATGPSCEPSIVPFEPASFNQKGWSVILPSP